MKKIFFLTSSETKMANARHLARHYDVEILPFFDYGKSYDEPRMSNREMLLSASFEDAKRRIINKRGSIEGAIFFIEDTSVVISALSTEGCEVPGVDIKYWMKNRKFDDLDKSLRKKGNDRTAVVRSDVLLFDGIVRDRKVMPKRFIALTEGSIVSEELLIETQSLYPWLDSKTFNKWFVPQGQSLPLSALPIEIADQFDIRSNSIDAALSYLEKIGVIRKMGSCEVRAYQTLLEFSRPRLLIVCGLPCSGKTTLGEILAENYGFYYIEASDFMHFEYRKLHGYDATISLEQFAKDALVQRPEIVARSVVSGIARSGSARTVVTGFRSEKEIEFVKDSIGDSCLIDVIWIKALPRVRYARSRARSREDAVSSFQEFRVRDQLQEGMGLAVVKKHFTDIEISNTSTSLERYRHTISALVGRSPTPFILENLRTKERPAELHLAIGRAILLADRRSEWFTTTEIAHIINATYLNSGIKTHKDNVSRFFNSKQSPYFRSKKSGRRNKFKITSTGFSKSIFTAVTE